MDSHDSADITLMLSRAAARDSAAAAELLPVVYQQLRAAAQLAMNNERAGHTLNATALVHEAYLRLAGGLGGAGGIPSRDRAQFFHAAAEAMRRILIEHARGRARIKRGGDGRRAAGVRVSLDHVDVAAHEEPELFLSLDEAIRRLESDDGELGSIVRLRFFSGLTIEQTAETLGISAATVKRRWEFARASLLGSLERSGEVEASDG